MKKNKIPSSDMENTQSTKQLSAASSHSKSKNVKFKTDSDSHNEGDPQYSSSFTSSGKKS